jgi:hypothetical protein
MLVEFRVAFANGAHVLTCAGLADAKIENNGERPMASLTPDFIKTYPKLTKYLRNEFRNVPAKADVWKAFLKWSELPERLALEAVTFSPGALPICGITSTRHVNGIFLRNQPRYVWLHQRVATLFEKGKKGSRLLVESTLLHEMVHWGNYISQYGLDSRELTTSKDSSGKVRGGYTKTDSGLKEVGKAFEIDAYGRDVNAMNMGGAIKACGTCK